MQDSENKIIGYYFGNEAGPGVLQSSVQQMCILKEIQTTRLQLTRSQGLTSFHFSILAVLKFVERWTGALQVQSRFQTVQIA